MVAFTYTDRRDAISKIERLLGREGSREKAESMFDSARDSGWCGLSEDDLPVFEASDKGWEILLLED